MEATSHTTGSASNDAARSPLSAATNDCSDGTTGTAGAEKGPSLQAAPPQQHHQQGKSSATSDARCSSEGGDTLLLFGTMERKHIPLILTIVAFLVVTLPSLKVRPSIYSYNASVPPYSDTGFQLTPDWSKNPHLLNEGYVLTYTFGLGIFIALFGEGPPKLTILRRVLFTLTCGQLIQLVQMFSTVFPDPNPSDRKHHLFAGQGHHHPDRAWAFMNYPVLYVVGMLTITFYYGGGTLDSGEPEEDDEDAPGEKSGESINFGTPRAPSQAQTTAGNQGSAFDARNTAARGSGAANTAATADEGTGSGVGRISKTMIANVSASSIGCALLIPTRYVYTVDMLSALIAGILPFLVYHWYVRTRASIKKRRFLRWYEQDSFVIAQSSRGDVNTNQNQNPSVVIAIPQSPGVEGGSQDFGLEEFRVQSFVGTERETMNGQLIDRVAKLGLPVDSSTGVLILPRTPMEAAEAAAAADRVRYRWIASSFLLAVGVGVLAAGVTYFAVHYADKQRPIFKDGEIVLAQDVLFNSGLPQVPAHAADVFLYIQVAFTGMGTLTSSLRFTILRRTLFMFGALFLMRCVTVVATFPPDPSPLCAKPTHAKGVTCGDLIYSGHTTTFLLTAFAVRHYCRIWWVEPLTWIWTSIGLCMVVASRLHYTRDVITAIIVGSCFIHLCYVTMFFRPDRKLKYPLLFWFEFDYSWWMWKQRVEEERKLKESEAAKTLKFRRKTPVAGGGGFQTPVSLKVLPAFKDVVASDRTE